MYPSDILHFVGQVFKTLYLFALVRFDPVLGLFQIVFITVVFLERGNPCSWWFYATNPVNGVRVKSYDCLTLCVQQGS